MKKSKIQLRAIAQDEATGEYLAIITFRKIDESQGELIVPRSTLRAKEELEEKLLDAGCSTANGQEVQLDLSHLSERGTQVERWIYSARTGWRDKHRQF